MLGGFQHGLGQDAIALGGIVNEHMGHGAHQLPILEDGAAAHALDNAAGGLQEPLVRDLHHELPGVVAAGREDPDDLHGVLLHVVPGDVGADDGGTHLHLAPGGHGDRGEALGQAGVGKGAEDAAGSVGEEAPQVPLHLEGAMELPGLSGLSLPHVGDLGVHDGARLQGHQQGGVHIVDAVAQGAEEAGGGVIEGHSADAGHGIPNPGPQLIGSVVAGDRLGGELDLLVPPHGPDAHLVPLQILEDLPDLLDGVHLGVVDVGDDVPLLQAAGPGGAAEPA